MKFFSRKNLIYTGAGIAIIIIMIVVLGNGNGKQTIEAVKMDVVQEVAATGKVKPDQSVNLGFDKSGRVANVYVSVGEIVEQGKIIATLESQETVADLAKARALLLEENAKLREIKSVASVSYDDASKNLDAAIKEGFADADNAIRNRADQFFKNTTDNPQFEVSITSGNFIHYFNVPSDITTTINSNRKKIEDILINWQKRILNLNSLNLASEANQAINDLNFMSVFLDKVAGAVNTFMPVEYSYETTVNNYKTTIATARSEVSGAISSIVTAKDKLNSAPILGASGQFENVLAQEAKVSQAEAAASSLEATLNKSVIKAPFAGVVTLQDAKVGGTVTAGANLVSLISRNKMYIEANISEIHIGKIMVGNPALVSFDAFPNEEFIGQVSYIEPGDVLIDGIVNYKIRIDLEDLSSKIKSGLTANIKIQTLKKEGVLAIPLYAVVKENGQNFVNKITTGNQLQKTPVNLGISGSNGFAEVLDGLREGDIVGF